MRSPTSRWLFWLGMVATPLGAATVHAQPTPRDHRDDRRPAPPPPEPRDHRDGHGEAHGDGPREAPPAPRAETPGARAGYLWVTGRWAWSNGKYEWTAGHWERERAGKHWREGRWEQRADHWAYSDGGWDDGAATASPPTPPAGGPHEAPPSPRAETPGTRAGYVWAAGEWTWTNGTYAWVPGHWERERAGKHWRSGRWESRDGSWARVEGGWDDGAGDRDHDGDRDRDRDHRGHREWRLDRPVVSSYWPVKGKPGTRIVIRGRNFPTSAQVTFAGAPVPGAKVTPDRIVFVLPANAASGLIALATGRARPLPVGSFEVAASFDAAAEQQRLDAERKAKAEAAWAARRTKLANDRAARLAAMTQHQQELATTREQRRAVRIAELQAQFDRAFLADEETQAELTLHAQRSAELARMREVAELAADAKIGVRIELAQQREEDRHTERMTSLKAAFAAGGSR